MSETFYFKMGDTDAVFFNVNFMKIKRRCIKVCKKKNLSCTLNTKIPLLFYDNSMIVVKFPGQFYLFIYLFFCQITPYKMH